MKNAISKNKNNHPGRIADNPLKIVCIVGLALTLIVSWSMVLFGVIWRGDAAKTGSDSFTEAGSSREKESAFARELREYDHFDAPKRVLEGESPEQIERRLSRLEKQARRVEEHLSVLKRLRVLAQLNRRYISGYEKAAREAAETFPHSIPMAMVAADAVVLNGNSDAGALLKSYAGKVSQGNIGLINSLGPLELSLYVLSGELEDPVRAAALPGLENLLSQDLSGLPLQIRQDLLVDEFLLRVVKGDVSGATSRLNTLLATNHTGLWRMGAEFFYDHQNPLRAAELFSRLAGDRDAARAADALALSGEIPGARNIWFALSSSPDNTTNLSRIYYNLAVSSTDKKEESAWLEKLFTTAQRRQASMDNTRIYSIIRYTRLLDTSHSIAVLSEAVTSAESLVSGERGMKQHPLLDLELHRRRLDTWPPNRAAAELWLLLGRNPGEQALYEWTAWYFDHQKLYTETSRLLIEAARKGMSGSWVDLHRSLALIRDGKTSEGEKLLKEAGSRIQGPAGAQDWRILANLGRIQESRRAVSTAIEYYEAAAGLAREKTAAAQVLLRLSRCLEALGKRQESRRALESALELDPDNFNIRLELRRIDSSVRL